MKRSFLKRRRSTPRPWEDRSGRRLYVEASRYCERCGECRELDPEHVAGRGWKGADDWRNLLRVCRRCHTDYLNQSRGGRIESLHLKMQTDPEFSLTWFDERVGYILSGKLSNWIEDDATDERHKTMIRELLEHGGNPQSVSLTDVSS